LFDGLATFTNDKSDLVSRNLDLNVTGLFTESLICGLSSLDNLVDFILYSTA